MRRGLCVKCGTPTVYRKLNGISHGGDSSGGVYVRTGWLTAASPVEHLICTRCGYFESYVIDERKMSEITTAACSRVRRPRGESGQNHPR